MLCGINPLNTGDKCEHPRKNLILGEQMYDFAKNLIIMLKQISPIVILLSHRQPNCTNNDILINYVYMYESSYALRRTGNTDQIFCYFFNKYF